MAIPLVSIIMPVYNGAHYLNDAIDSILHQTFIDFELVIINDGSTDKSESIVLSYEDERIRYLKNECNKGICFTLNRGVSIAQGKYVARMDCDDISNVRRLEKQVCFLENNLSVGIVGCDLEIFGDGIEKNRYFHFVHTSEDCKAGLLFDTCFAHPAVMFRRSIVAQHKLYYDEEYRGLEDFELWWRMADYCDFANLPEALLYYRIHGRQITQNITEKVSMKSKAFMRERLTAYCSFNEHEFKLFDAYCCNNWEYFNNDNISILFNLLRKIKNSPVTNKSDSYKKSMCKTLAKVIANVAQNTKNVTIPKAIMYTKAYMSGMMPFVWYAKYMSYNFLGK